MTAEQPAETQELDDRWVLPLRGSSVTAIDVGENVVFSLDSGVRVIIGDGAYFTQGSIKAPDADVRTVREWGADVVGRAVGAKVLSAVGFKSGALRVVLSSGWQLNVSSAPEPFVPAAVVDGDTVLWARVAPTTTD
jgi:hypothetical protein